MALSVSDALAQCAAAPLPVAALVVVGGLCATRFALGVSAGPVFLNSLRCVLTHPSLLFRPLQLLGTFYRYFLRPAKQLTKLGKYAVVTGATDGIGKAYALALAKQGLSVVLISRTEAKLQAVAAEIDAHNHPGVEKTQYVVCDYSQFEGGDGARVAAALAGLDVAVLINNVGLSYRYPRFFHELPYAEAGALMSMNVASTVWMTKLVIEGMADRGRGTVVNLSSGSAGHAMPLLAEYGAAKMFVARFSESLDAEYRGRGVRVQCQVPFYVATKLAKLRKSAMVPTPRAYVGMSLRWLGHGGVVSPVSAPQRTVGSGGRFPCVPLTPRPPPLLPPQFWLHALQGWVMSSLPAPLVDAAVMKMHAGIRKRGLKKDAKVAAEAQAAGKTD
jgi:17beta-estradiol 17-dehydrogenase / very-long-chain 3-oxoacyl-CoA reductase